MRRECDNCNHWGVSPHWLKRAEVIGGKKSCGHLVELLEFDILEDDPESASVVRVMTPAHFYCPAWEVEISEVAG